MLVRKSDTNDSLREWVTGLRLNAPSRAMRMRRALLASR
jgi:hypothetical protein